MRQKRLPGQRARRGATLVLVAIVMAAILAVMALAIDLGMGFTARSEAQRVADAAALAAGSAFLEFKAADAVPVAEDRAYDYALRNSIRNVPVDSSEVTVQVIQAERKVRVWINRDGLATWFARILGIDALDVGAMAAAEATDAGTARCLKPFALPDIWADGDQDIDPYNRLWDPGEEWVFDPSQDYYERYDGDTNSLTATGLGSDYRDGIPDSNFDKYDSDYGRPLDIKLSDPNSEYQAAPGLFLPWRIPADPDIEDCGRGGGGGSRGAAVYRRNICACNTSPVNLFEPYPVEPGNMIGPTNQGTDDLMEQDPDAVWDWSLNGGKGGVSSPIFGDGLASPRIMKVALFDSNQINKGGMQDIEFNNFALMFLVGQATNKAPVVARFMYYVSGESDPGNGGGTGSLVLVLRLVE